MHVQACRKPICLDLSPNMLHGRLTGNKVVNWDIKVCMQYFELCFSSVSARSVVICPSVFSVILLLLKHMLTLSGLLQDMINCVGGLPVLLPILEQLTLLTPDLHHVDPLGSEFITPESATPADGDWVILPSNRASGEHTLFRSN